MDASKFIDRLENLKSVGENRWRARCPCHQGQSRSLSIKVDSDRLLIKCFSGCSALEIIHSVGLEMSDLFARPTKHVTPPVAREYRIHSNARETLEAILVAITILMMGCEKAFYSKLTLEEYEEVSKAYTTIIQALHASRINLKYNE